MGINIDYAKIAEALVKNIQQGDRSEGQLAPEEKEYLHSMGVKGLTDQVYMGALNKIGANTQTERKVVIEELKKFTDRIGELVPNYQEFSEIILELFQNAMNVKTVEELFKLFGDKISELEKADKNKSTEDKDLERLIFKNTSYAEQMNNNDYSRLIEILTSNPAKYNPEIKNNENSTIFKFKYNNKSYEITINKRYDVEAIEKTIIKNTPKSTEEFENIIKSFARGELHWSDFAEQLKLFGFSEAELSNASKYNYLNDGYEITLNFNGKKYTFNCNIKGANDSVSSNNPGETYTLLEPNEVKNQGFTEEQLATYFVKAVVIDGKVEYYTKNKAAWETLGLSSKDSIATLKNTIKKAEDLQHITDVVNEVINDMTNKYTLTSYEVDQLRGYLQNGAQKNKIEGLLGKDDDQIKSSVTFIAEAYITETIRKTSGTKGADAASTSSLTDAQNAKINSVCADIASKVGLNDTEKTELIRLLKEAAATVASSSSFDFYIKQEALHIASDIVAKRDNTSEDIDDIVSGIENHRMGALSDLKAAYDKGLIGLKITKDGPYDYYRIQILGSNGEVLCTEDFSKKELEDAGFNLPEPDGDGNVTINKNGYNSQNVTDNQKNAYILELCNLTLFDNTGNTGVEDLTASIHSLTYDQAMKLYNELRTYFNSKTYTNLDTFKKDARDKAKELGKKYVDENAKAGTSRGTTSTTNEVPSEKFGHLMSQLYSSLNSNGFIQGEPDFTSDPTRVTIKIKTKNGTDAGEIVITKNEVIYNGYNSELMALLPQIRAAYK